jgi:hypothetical protein
LSTNITALDIQGFEHHNIKNPSKPQDGGKKTEEIEEPDTSMGHITSMCEVPHNLIIRFGVDV